MEVSRFERDDLSDAFAAALIRLVRDEGLDAVTVARLSREAGVNRTSFYRRFGSIDDGCRACFTVSERMEGVRSRSAIAFGDVRVDDTRLAEALNGIVDKYVPEPGREGARMGIPQASGRAVALVMGIAHASAKVVDKPAGR